MSWVVAHEDLELFVDHKSLLELVVQQKDAFW